jgi:glucose dehydrogenase
MCKIAVYFDRNGFGYTMDRVSGELFVAQKYDPVVNWLNGVNLKTGLHDRVAKYLIAVNGEDVNTTGICPAVLGSKDQ